MCAHRKHLHCVHAHCVHVACMRMQEAADPELEDPHEFVDNIEEKPEKYQTTSRSSSMRG